MANLRHPYLKALSDQISGRLRRSHVDWRSKKAAARTILEGFLEFKDGADTEAAAFDFLRKRLGGSVQVDRKLHRHLSKRLSLPEQIFEPLFADYSEYASKAASEAARNARLWSPPNLADVSALPDSAFRNYADFRDLVFDHVERMRMEGWLDDAINRGFQIAQRLDSEPDLSRSDHQRAIKLAFLFNRVKVIAEERLDFRLSSVIEVRLLQLSPAIGDNPCFRWMALLNATNVPALASGYAIYFGPARERQFSLNYDRAAAYRDAYARDFHNPFRELGIGIHGVGMDYNVAFGRWRAGVISSGEFARAAERCIAYETDVHKRPDHVLLYGNQLARAYADLGEIEKALDLLVGFRKRYHRKDGRLRLAETSLTQAYLSEELARRSKSERPGMLASAMFLASAAKKEFEALENESLEAKSADLSSVLVKKLD